MDAVGAGRSAADVVLSADVEQLTADVVLSAAADAVLSSGRLLTESSKPW